MQPAGAAVEADVPGGLDWLRAILDGSVEQAPVAHLVGMRFVSAEPGLTVWELEASREHANPMGTIHGGILCDLADAAMGTAWVATLGEGETFTTLELKINFTRPFWSGLLRAEGRVLKGGRTIGLLACDVTDADGRLIAHATSTCMTLRGDAAAGR